MFNRTRTFRSSDQLVVSWAKLHTVNPSVSSVSPTTLWRRLMLPMPPKDCNPLRSHSTSGAATSWAMFRVATIEEIQYVLQPPVPQL